MSLRRTLPQNASDLDGRAADLAEGKHAYEWDYSWPPGVGTAKEIKKTDSYGLRYAARAFVLNQQFVHNHIDLEPYIKGESTFDHRAFMAEMKSKFEGEKPDLTDLLFNAPEHVLGRDMDGRTDLFMLGVTALEVLKEHTPHDREPAVSVLVKHVTEDLPDPRENPDFPRDLAELIYRSTRRLPQARFGSCMEAADWLLQQGGEMAPPTATSGGRLHAARPRRWSSRPRFLRRNSSRPTPVSSRRATPTWSRCSTQSLSL